MQLELKKGFLRHSLFLLLLLPLQTKFDSVHHFRPILCRWVGAQLLIILRPLLENMQILNQKVNFCFKVSSSCSTMKEWVNSFTAVYLVSGPSVQNRMQIRFGEIRKDVRNKRDGRTFLSTMCFFQVDHHWQ